MSLNSNGGNRNVTAKNFLGNIGRTKVHNHYDWRTTFSSGKLLPLWAKEIYPAMNESINLGELVRSITPLGPVMDNAFLDLFFFFVPSRLVWDHWEEFIAGYNKEAWAQDVVYTVPQITVSGVASVKNPATDNGQFVHSFMDYCYGACDVIRLQKDLYASTGSAANLALCDEIYSISALYPRSFIKIWNDYFRDENLQDEYQLYTGDNDVDADDFEFNLLDATKLPPVGKYHNRFTNCLPKPCKGPDVLIPMDNLPVGIVPTSTATLSATAFPAYVAGTSLTADEFKGIPMYSGQSLSTDGLPLIAKNVSNTIRQLRLATQTELLLARDARGGTRYVESLLAHFKVHNGDARLQRAEYLGSRHIPLGMTQVTNTAGTASDALGNVGAQSVTKDNAHYFSKGFTEHGILWCVGCVRTNLSYSSGRMKQYTRKSRFDFIWPEFKHLGDVGMPSTELKQDLVGYTSGRVFGYTPYGSELREGYNTNSGLFRKGAPGSLSYLTYQEDYGTGQPTLSDTWIQQPKDVIDATLVDQSGPQFYALFILEEDSIIPLDPTSDPGLMDHF